MMTSIYAGAGRLAIGNGAALLLLCMMPAGASGAEIACPARLPADAAAVGKLGFRTLVDADPPKAAPLPVGHPRLSDVRFSDGPPEEQAWLAPTGPGQHWDFGDSGIRKSYLTCAYGRTLLSRPLVARSCNVHRKAGGFAIACN